MPRSVKQLEQHSNREGCEVQLECSQCSCDQSATRREATTCWYCFFVLACIYRTYNLLENPSFGLRMSVSVQLCLCLHSHPITSSSIHIVNTTPKLCAQNRHLYK